MSRLSMRSSLGLILMSAASVTWAQGWNANPSATMDRFNSAGVRDSTMIDLSQPSVSDPKAVDQLFREGDEISSILAALNEKGFHIEYKEKHFRPTMVLLSIPQEEVIDDVLREILEPWEFRVYRNPLGKIIVTPTKKRKEINAATAAKVQNAEQP